MIAVTDRSFLFVLALAFLLAFGIRTTLTEVYVGLNSPPDGEANPDQIEYELYAHNMSVGAGYVTASGIPTADRPPGTSLALWPVYEVFGRNYAAGRLWFCILSAATCVVIGVMGARIFGYGTGLISATGLAVLPNHAYYSLHFLSETPFSLAIALACLFTVRALGDRHSSTFSSFLAGLAWGFGILVRPHVALALPLLWVFLLRHENRRQTFGALLIICLTASLVIAPWAARNALVLGTPTLSTVGGLTFWGANNEKVLAAYPGGWLPAYELVDESHPLKGDELSQASLAWKYGKQFVSAHTSDLPFLALMKVYRFFSPSYPSENTTVSLAFAIGWLSAAPLFIIGVLIAWRRDRDAALVLLIPFVATLLTVVIFYGSARFRDSLAPLYVLFAGYGLTVVADRLSKSNGSHE